MHHLYSKTAWKPILFLTQEMDWCTTSPAVTAGLKRLACICQELLEQARLPNSVLSKDGEVPELMRSG